MHALHEAMALKTIERAAHGGWVASELQSYPTLTERLRITPTQNLQNRKLRMIQWDTFGTQCLVEPAYKRREGMMQMIAEVGGIVWRTHNPELK